MTRKQHNAVEWNRLVPDLAVPVLDDDGAYSAVLAAIRNLRTSGVYLIVDSATREPLYVGESHTGRLYDTITRHFRRWRRRDDEYARRYGGTTYNREEVSIVFVLADDDDAQALQYAYVQSLNPRDNVTRGETVVEVAEDDGGLDEVDF